MAGGRVGRVSRVRRVAATVVCAAALVASCGSDGDSGATPGATATGSPSSASATSPPGSAPTSTTASGTGSATGTTGSATAAPSAASTTRSPSGAGSASATGGTREFVAVVRAQVPAVASGRTDAEIAAVARTACRNHARGTSADDVVAQAQSRGTLDAEATDQATARELVKLAIDTVCLDQAPRVDEF